MNWFTDFFTGKLAPHRVVLEDTPAPVPPSLPVTAPVPAPPGTNTILLESWNRPLRKYMVMDVPFLTSTQMDIKPALAGTVAKFRITVVTGTLTVISMSTSGLHKPYWKTTFKRGTKFQVGESFTAECKLQERTGGRHGYHDESNWSMHTAELGLIASMTVSVSYKD